MKPGQGKCGVEHLDRISAAAERRADLDLHISLLAEHEVTKLAELVAAMAQRMGVEKATDPEIEEIKRDVAPEAVLDKLEAGAEGDGAAKAEGA